MTEELQFSFHVESATLIDVMRVIQDCSLNAAFAVDGTGSLVGMITDGDVRRALLGGASVGDLAHPYLSREPLVVNERESRAVALDIMRARRTSQIPVVNEVGVLVGVHTLQGLIGRQRRDNTAVVLAGGRGTRLYPLTSDTPKPMVRVAGRPILERVITHLVGHGLTDIVLAVGYHADAIADYFGDGTDFGCSIRYMREDPESPRGTCGPLSQLDSLTGPRSHPVLVINGDLVTSVDASALLDAHQKSGAMLTMATKELPFELPYAVVDVVAGQVVGLSEKPVFEHNVNIGVYVLSRECLSMIPRDGVYHMTRLIEELIAGGLHVHGWRSEDDWIDVGSPVDLGRARGHA